MEIQIYLVHLKYCRAISKCCRSIQLAKKQSVSSFLYGIQPEHTYEGSKVSPDKELIAKDMNKCL